MYRCELCNKEYSHEYKMKIHFKNAVAHQEKPEFKCDICKKLYWSAANLDHHIRYGH